MLASQLDEHYIHEQEYAHFLSYKRGQYPDLLELVEIKTPWTVVEEVLAGNYEHISEEIEHSLAYDTLRVMAANLW